MKAARLLGPLDFKIVDHPTPEPGHGEVVSKVVRAGMCGTDYAIYSGEFSFVKNGMVPFPITMGHEWSGVVSAIGEGVTRFKVGDRVVGDTGVSCGVCYECLMGDYGHCAKLRCVGTVNTWDGAYAEYILMPERHMFHLPDSVSFDLGAMIEPAATATFSVHQAGVRPGETVVVTGTGPIGIIAAKMAKIYGAAKVIIVGRKDFKLNIAKEWGIDYAINISGQTLKDAVGPYIDRGADRVIEAAGSTDLLKECFDIAKIGATIAIVAFYEKKIDGFDIDRLVFNDLTLKPVAGSLGMYGPVLSLMSSGMFDCTNLITARLKFQELPNALATMQTDTAKRIKHIVEME